MGRAQRRELEAVERGQDAAHIELPLRRPVLRDELVELLLRLPEREGNQG